MFGRWRHVYTVQHTDRLGTGRTTDICYFWNGMLHRDDRDGFAAVEYYPTGEVHKLKHFRYHFLGRVSGSTSPSHYVYDRDGYLLQHDPFF